MIRASEFKNIRLFPIINNRDAFLIKEHPELHPETSEYVKYWKEQKIRCIEGFWGNDTKELNVNNWRYASGPLYWYVNMWSIKLQDPVQKSEYYARPFLRDTEWIIFNAILSAQGFSGFDGDEEITCHRLVKKYYDSVEGKRSKSGELITLNKLEQRELDNSNSIKRPNGEYKEYVEAYEYLKRTFSKPLGKPLYENPVKNLLLLSARAIGKDLEENTLVYAEYGKVKIKDINIGDKIYGRDGKLTKVISKDYYFDQQQFLITFQDNRTVECGGGHLWTVKPPGKRYPYKTLTTEFIYNNIKKRVRSDKDRHIKESYWFVPENESINYKKRELPIDPYLIGLWLGDGTSKRVGITTLDEEIKDYIYSVAKSYNNSVSINQNLKKTCPTYFITDGVVKNADKRLLNEFKKLNLFNNKHIPDIYLKSSKEDRIELLRGLMDSDGTTDSNGANFSTSSERLRDDFYRLVRELGIKCSLGVKYPTYSSNGVKKQGKKSYRIHIRPEFNPFRLKRKFNKYTIKKSKALRSLGIKSIEKTSIKPSICIGVDNNDSLFLVNDYIVTHNSYSISAVGGHEFTFDGLKYYLPANKVKTQSGVFVGAADGDKSTDLIIKIKEGLDALPGSFGEGDDFVPSPFFKQIKGSWNEGESVEHSYKVQEGGQWKTKGSKSKIFHGNFGHDTHDAVGKRCTKIFVEEFGELDKVETIHSANERVLKVGNNKFGMEFGIGTGGNVKYINGTKKLFYNPSQYDYYEFEDVHENSGKIGLFIPATYAYNELKDEDGNTDLDAALEMCVQIRNEKATADTSMPLDMEMMYAPLKPSEVFLNPNQNKFPVALLRSRQVHLELNGLFKAKAQFGTLEYTRDNSIRWMPDMTLKPITTYRVDERADLRGSIVIYEHPGDLIKPLYNRSLHKIAYDVVGSEGGGSSLASIIVYKGMPDSIQDPSEMRNTIVAEYIGRLNNVDNIHEIAIRLAKYYRARILYEDNVPGFLTYCRQNGHLDLLQPTPAIALGEIYKGDFKKNKFGIRMTSQLIDAADNKTRAWFLQEIDKDENGVVTRFNVDSIYSPRFLDEYINFDGIGNFDHISCFRIIQLWLADEVAVPITATEEFKKENVIIERALRHREDGVKKFLKY